MKHFKVITLSNAWWTMDKLNREVEKTLKRLSQDGNEIISVSFARNTWSVMTAFITVSTDIK